MKAIPGAKPVQYCGIEYKSLKDLFKSKASDGISYNTFLYRISSGWELERALKEKKHKGNPVQVNGVIYDNFQHAYYSLKPSASFGTVKTRLRTQWSAEDAFEVTEKIDGRKVNIKKLTINGKIFSMKEAAEKFGIKYNTILYRLNHGATTEQAVGISPIFKGDLISNAEVYKNRKVRVKETYIVDGTTYKSIPELAKAFGLSINLVYRRIRRGLSAKQAVTEPVYDPVIVNGTTYRSALNALETIGQTSFSAYYSRKMAGHSLEVCLGLDELPNLYRYELHGKKYKSISEIALAYDLDARQLTDRLKRMSLEEAIDYFPLSGGLYCETIFKRNTTLAQTIGRLYFIRITLPSGILHKVGITQQDVSRRFSGFMFHTIAEYQGALSLLYQVEQKVLKEFRDCLYRANEDFRGKTETFLLTDDKEMEVTRFISSLATIHGFSNVHA